jgi:hypothetical protein
MSSDVSTSAYRIQHLLGEENYQTWSVKITDILTDLGLDNYPRAAFRNLSLRMSIPLIPQ